MSSNKKIIISIGIIFCSILMGVGIMKITVSILYPENVLTNFLKSGFKDIIGKAIRFDTIYIKFNGDIVVENFYLSNSDDFNDNINLIKCDEIIIHTSFFDLIRKKITFTGISMIEPDITIIKNYGKTYRDVFIDDIVSDINKDKVNEYIVNNFRFELIDSTLSFTDIFKNSKAVVNFYNLDLKLKYNSKDITFKSSGNIHNKVRSGWLKAGYKSSGKIYLDKKYYEAGLTIKNFDLNYLTSMLNDVSNKKPQVFGIFDGKFNIINNDDIITCSGKIDISSLDLFYTLQENQYPFFKKDNIQSKFNINFSKELDKFTIDELIIDNGPLKLNSTFNYSKDGLLSIKINSNKVNLEELSESVCFFRNSKYTGEANIDGTWIYNLKDNKPENVELNLVIDKFNILPLNENSRKIAKLTDGDFLLIADKENISLKSKFIYDNSDFDIIYNGQILNWQPIKSSNKIEISSKNLRLNFLKDIVVNGIRKIYTLAYLDVLQNFDEQKNFLNEPEGILINNNDFAFKLHADQLYLAGQSHIDNLNMDLSLIKGVLKTNYFSVEGYKGIYHFDFYSYMRQSYPLFKIKAEFSDLDLTSISEDSKLDYSFGGNLSVNINFETNAYRVGQIVENARAGIDISVKDGYINNIPFQNKLNEFLNQTSYKDRFNRRVDYSKFSISFTQSANNYIIRNFILQSPDISFFTYGAYSVDNGLNIPLSLNITQDNKQDKLPMEVSGTLESPCINIKPTKGKDKTEQQPMQPLCF